MTPDVAKKHRLPQRTKFMQACLIVSGVAAMLLPMSDPTPVIDDLREEGAELDRLVAESGTDQWALTTPAPRWTVAHQIAHLAWTDHSSLLAVTDQDAFAREVEKALAAPGDFVDNGAEDGAAKPPPSCSRTGEPGARPSTRRCARHPPGRVSPGTAPLCRSPPWPPPG